jgi:TolB-like protein/class 3 adenylate cyclase/tetratricopeptide (TPR) repeat protein
MPDMPEEPNRRLAAILFTDIVGYTALMAADEERGLRVRQRHRALVLPIVERHRGEPIELRGDECLSIFPSALDAVRCALDLLHAVEREPDLDLHLGIHVGDIVRVGAEVSGDGVNVASRLCALSEGGGLCVSAEVRQAVRNQPDIEAVPLGARELKNTGRPVEVFALGRPGRVRPAGLPRAGNSQRRLAMAAAAAVLLGAVVVAGWWSWEASTTAQQPIRSVAVLPLDNLTGDPSQEYFADGMTEALIADLAQIASLRVTSRTTAKQYRGTQRPLTEIAAELGVDALIEGSVFREGDRVRVTTQLIDARRDEHLWAEQFDRDLSGVLGLQREIASDVARQVQARMAPRVAERLGERPSVVPEAQEAYMKGLYFAQKHTPPAAQRARAHFEESMRFDPEYPLGYAGLADTLSCSPMHTWVVAAEGDDIHPTAVMDLAEQLAERAIELDADLPEARTALGLVHVFREWNWDAAMAEFDAAVELNPSYEFVRRARALTLASLGRLDEARRDVDVALESDPLNAMVADTAGDIYAWRGEHERAVSLWREAIELDAGNPLGSQSLGLHHCRTGDPERGLSLLRKAAEISLDDPLVVGDIGHCLAISGRAQQARELLASLQQRSQNEWVSPVSLARIHVGLGEHDAALLQLQRAVQERAYRLVELELDDRWDPIREDEQFREIVRRVGVRARARSS